MKLRYYLLSFLFCSVYCACDQTDDDTTARNIRYHLRENQVLRLEPFLDSLLLPNLVASEDSSVLQIVVYFDPFPTSIDDEYTYTLHLPISNAQTDFTWIDQQLTDNGVGLSLSGFVPREFRSISEGTVVGNRLPNGNWIVNGSVKVPAGFDPTDFPTDFQGIFTD